MGEQPGLICLQKKLFFLETHSSKKHYIFAFYVFLFFSDLL